MPHAGKRGGGGIGSTPGGARGPGRGDRGGDPGRGGDELTPEQ